MKAILYENGIEVRRVNDFSKVSVNIDYPDLPNGFEWKLVYVDLQPVYNPHLERLDSAEVDNDEQHPDYPDFKMIRVEWTKVRKSDAEITELLKQQEDNANRQLLDKFKYLALYAGIANRRAKGLNISAKMLALETQVEDKLTKLWQNDTNLSNKLQELANGQDPDINTGWANE